MGRSRRSEGTRRRGAATPPNPRRLRLHAVDAGGAESTSRKPSRGRKKEKRTLGHVLEKLSLDIAQRTGTSAAFTIALCGVLVWALTGPLFHFSDTWQLVINTATTVVTFLMVFLIQRAQNKDTRAIELKLDALIAAARGASNRLINVEDLPEEELHRLREYYSNLETSARKDQVAIESRLEEAPRSRG